MHLAPEKREQPELLPDDAVLVASRRWDSNGARLCVVREGATLEGMVREALEKAYPGRNDSFYSAAMTYCRARLDGMEVLPLHWHEFTAQAGQRVEVLIAPGKGGGGKNPLATVLSLVVVVAAVVFQQHYLLPALKGMGWAYAAGELTALGTAAMVAGTAVVGMAGMMAVNALFPVSLPTANANTPELENSQTYSLNGGQNAANPGGYVPLVLGKYRMTPPLGAKSWTHYQGDDQYLNMLVIWGHADVVVEDFMIGDTPLSKFSGVTHVFHGSSTGNDLKYFNRSYNEQSIGATLNYNEPVVRTVGECDRISVDIGFSALADVSEGDPTSYAVQFRIEYAKVGTEDWQTFSQSTRFFAPAQYVDTYGGISELNIWATSDGVWHAASSYDESQEPGWQAGKIRLGDSLDKWDVYPVERYKDKHKHHEWWTRDAWYDGGTSSIVTISGKQTTPLTRSFEWAVPHGEYQVRITRVSADTDDSAILDTGVWSAARAIRNRAAFNTPVPVACSELRIKATEELSGYVSDFNALVTSFVPDWNGTEWDTNETSNPASLLRYCLLSRHGSYSPYSEAKLDEQSFIDFWKHCNANGYTFNFVADTETLTWKRMVQIAAAGRGAVTFDNDGLISVIIDKAGKTPVQMFTPRNSWGFSVERTYQKYPHALRASFRNAAQDYEESNGYVYADGYSASNATNIVEWEAEGKTNWNEVWKFGRYYLANMRLRPETVTLSTDWEWRMCRRGDLVLVAHDVLTNTFGVARIVALVYDVDGEELVVSREEAKPEGLVPVGVVLDDSVIFSEPAPARYGIAVRMATGRVNTFEVLALYGQESARLRFRYTITAAQVPPLGALASVALFGSSNETELGQYLVAGITPGENMSADLTLIPYAPEIEDADSGAIPAWTAPVRLPGIPRRDDLPVPVVKEVRSDESVIIRSGDSLISRIAMWYGLPSSPDASLGEVQVQMQATDDFGNVFTAMAPLTDPYVAVQGVEDGRVYKVALRLVSSRGVTSAWTTAHTVPVIGKTSVPPAVTGLVAAIADPQGVKLTWTASTVADFDHYEVSGAGELKTVNPGAVMQVYRRVGKLTFSVQAVDTLGLKSEKVEASVEVLPPAAPAPAYSVLPQRGAEVSWPDCKTTWSIDHYVVEDAYLGVTETYADGRFGISPRPLSTGYRFFLRAVDIFGNSGPVTEAVVTVGAMPAPAPAAKVDGTQVVISWAAVAAPFAVEWYEVQTANGQSVGKAKSTELRFEAPQAGVHGWRVRGIDIAGNIGPWGECSLTLGAPKAPVVSAALEGDLIALAWTKPKSDVPVVAYDIVRQWTVNGVTQEQDYGRNDTQALSVPAVIAGEHTFMVRAVDNSGNIGPWGTASFVAKAPGPVSFFASSAIDNHAQIFWTDPATLFFPVKEYVVSMLQNGIEGELGRTDGHFFSRMQSKGGDYTFVVSAVDVAGNVGPAARITLAVGDPPDFKLFLEGDSELQGERENIELSSAPALIGPAVQGETWAQNAARVAALLGLSDDGVTWEAKAQGGFTHYLSPAVAEGRYTEVIDVGVLMPSTKITLTLTEEVLEGDPVRRCRIEVSEDGQSWREMTDNSLSVYATSFRFVRVTLTWTGGMMTVTNLYFNLSVKRLNDAGSVFCPADDNAEGWVSEVETPELSGTFVEFNSAFTKVQSMPQPRVVDDFSGEYTPFVYMKAGELNPTGFRVWVLDKEGKRASATVDWSVAGV